jgi:MFS family permease
MSSLYLRLLKRHLKCVSFSVDGFWSWVLAFVGFVFHAVNLGVVHSLGVFFTPWIEKYQTSKATLIWVQSVFYACQLLFCPFVGPLGRIVPGQLLLFVGSLFVFAAFLIAAFVGKSVAALIILIGFICGTVSAPFFIYPLNLVGTAFDRFRPIAIGVVNLGAPVGFLVMPYVASALLQKYRLSIAIMDLGLICLLCGFLVVFLVEIDDKDDESNTEGVKMPNGNLWKKRK